MPGPQKKRLTQADKIALQNRLAAEGRWDAFVARRRELEAARIECGGGTQTEAKRAQDESWAEAAAEFSVSAAPEAPPEQPTGAESLAASQAKAPAVTHPGDADDPDAAVWTKLAVQVQGKKSHKRQEVDWVAQHVDVPVSALRFDQIPSASALSLLRWVRSSTGNRDDFFKNIWTKLMPNRSVSDADGRFQDDGRHVISLIDRVRKAAQAAQAPEVEQVDEPEEAVA